MNNNLSAYDVRKINKECLENGEPLKYTKEEFMNLRGFDSYEARLWNKSLPNAEQFTKEEIYNLTK